MRNIIKKEINILLSSRQHAMLAKLRETGINMSSISRLAIRKLGDAELIAVDDATKDKRVVIYLEEDDLKRLREIADQRHLSPSETLRRLIGTYLEANEDALNRLF